MSENGGNNPWAWLGLLKWSLAYTDGTLEGTSPPMSDEDKAFLERVIAEGIIDENERMKTILKEVTEMMTKWRDQHWNEEEEDGINELLQELRDIVEQIDYARAFTTLKGLEFLLGCVQERELIPKSTRSIALGILATLSSNNPPVQKQLLEMGALKDLSELFFAEENENGDSNGKFRARIIQAIGAIVRSHQMAEAVFCQLAQSPSLVMSGLGMGTEYSETDSALRQRTLFLLRALATSDYSTAQSMAPFSSAIAWASFYPLDDSKESSAEIREMALAFLQLILEQGKLVDMVIASGKENLVELGVRRISTLRALTGEDREFAAVELGLWESIMLLFARGTDASETCKNEKPSLLLAS